MERAKKGFVKKIVLVLIMAMVAVLAVAMAGCDDGVVTPEEKTLTGISVTAQPTKKDYLVGELFERTGMVVKANYSDNTSVELADYSVKTTPLAATDTKLTVTYQEEIGEEEFKDWTTEVSINLIEHPGTMNIEYQCFGTLNDPGLIQYNLQSDVMVNFYEGGRAVAYSYNYLRDGGIVEGEQGDGTTYDMRRGVYVSGTWSESTLLGAKTVAAELEYWSSAGGDPTRARYDVNGVVSSEGTLAFVLLIPIGSSRSVAVEGTSTVEYTTVADWMAARRQWHIDNPTEGIVRNIVFEKQAEEGIRFVVFDNFTCAFEITDQSGGKMMTGDNITWTYSTADGFEIDFSINSDYAGSDVNAAGGIDVTYTSPFANGGETVDVTLSAADIEEIEDIIDAPAGDEILAITGDPRYTLRLSWNGKRGSGQVDLGGYKVANIAWTFANNKVTFMPSLVNPGDFETYKSISEKDGTVTLEYEQTMQGNIVQSTFAFTITELKDAIDAWTSAQETPDVNIGDAPYVFTSAAGGTLTLNADNTITTGFTGNGGKQRTRNMDV